MTGKTIIKEAGVEIRKEMEEKAKSIIKDVLQKKREHVLCTVELNNILAAASEMAPEQIVDKYQHFYNRPGMRL